MFKSVNEHEDVVRADAQRDEDGRAMELSEILDAEKAPIYEHGDRHGHDDLPHTFRYDWITDWGITNWKEC